ncbi:MAG: hypothetical protein ACRETU_12115, partial [Steroidobacterales bacterium]
MRRTGPGYPDLRLWLLLCLGCCLSPLLLPAARADSPFVHPAELEPDIQFWTRIYTKVTTNGGLIHDDRYLGVVYE